jgi:hypothetical protein
VCVPGRNPLSHNIGVEVLPEVDVVVPPELSDEGACSSAADVTARAREDVMVSTDTLSGSSISAYRQPERSVLQSTRKLYSLSTAISVFLSAALELMVLVLVLLDFGIIGENEHSDQETFIAPILQE